VIRWFVFFGHFFVNICRSLILSNFDPDRKYIQKTKQKRTCCNNNFSIFIFFYDKDIAKFNKSKL